MRSISCASAFVLLALSCALVCEADFDLPFFIIDSSQVPIYRGRLDPIVQPGIVSNHVHRVYGGSAFQNFPATMSNESIYYAMLNSTCTTMEVSIDKSAYWFPDLYYQYADGNLTLVPVSNFRVYYQARSGPLDTVAPKYAPFPPGFRMTAGNPFRRNFTGTVAENALSWTCVYESTDFPGGALPYFNNMNFNCDGRMRAQLYFPTCWNGKDLDSPSHQAHIVYPIQRYNGGDCPAGFPNRTIGVFYEVEWFVGDFPQGQGRQPFVLSPGDPTGYGLHGDYLFGWDEAIFAQALTDPSCRANSTNNGQNPKACVPFQPYEQGTDSENCALDVYSNNYENIGYLRNISHVPGCNNITKVNATNQDVFVNGTSMATPRTGSYPQPSNLNPGGTSFRALIKSANNFFWFSKSKNYNITSTVPSVANISYSSVFVLTQVSPQVWTIQSEYSGGYASAQKSGAPIRASKDDYASYESFTFNFTNGDAGPTAAGASVTMRAGSNSKYLTLNGTVVGATSSAVVANSYFTLYDAESTLPAGPGCSP